MAPISAESPTATATATFHLPTASAQLPLSLEATAGVSVIGGILLVLIFVGVFMCIKQRRKLKEDMRRVNNDNGGGGGGGGGGDAPEMVKPDLAPVRLGEAGSSSQAGGCGVPDNHGSEYLPPKS